MSELKEHLFVPYSELQQGDELTDAITIAKSYYLKSEADKEIAELKDKLRHYPMMVALLESDKKKISEKDKEIQRLENLCESYRIDCDNIAIRESNAYKEIERADKKLRHHKYKRCLAMHDYCLCELEFAFRDPCIERSTEGCVRWRKWANLWLELAENFKEAR